MLDDLERAADARSDPAIPPPTSSSAEAPQQMFGGTSATDGQLSTITDSIILLRYVEVYGELRRGIAILKMRGSAHDKAIREVLIDATGMRIGKPCHGVTGIMGGAPVGLVPFELSRLSDAFERERTEPRP